MLLNNNILLSETKIVRRVHAKKNIAYSLSASDDNF